MLIECREVVTSQGKKWGKVGHGIKQVRNKSANVLNEIRACVQGET